MQNLLPLPDELLTQVYLYDSTYRQIYDIVMEEIELRAVHQGEREELEYEQDMEVATFELHASLYIADLLGEDIFSG